MVRALVVAVAFLGIIVGSGIAQVATVLERAYRDYRSLGGGSDVRTLVRLDREIRRVVPYWSWEGPPAESASYRTEYDILGVRPALFAPELLSYSGKLLAEAHRLDPMSHREYTLYATVFEGDEAANTLPRPVAAEEYLQEFPTGPFALYAHLALARFYADLFKVVRGEEEGRRVWYKYECFRPYLDTTTLIAQRTRAQERSVQHYVATNRLLPQVDDLARELTEMKAGRSSGWHYCAD